MRHNASTPPARSARLVRAPCRVKRLRLRDESPMAGAPREQPQGLAGVNVLVEREAIGIVAHPGPRRLDARWGLPDEAGFHFQFPGDEKLVLRLVVRGLRRPLGTGIVPYHDRTGRRRRWIGLALEKEE
jgi:hypothetical protein